MLGTSLIMITRLSCGNQNYRGGRFEHRGDVALVRMSVRLYLDVCGAPRGLIWNVCMICIIYPNSLYIMYVYLSSTHSWTQQTGKESFPVCVQLFVLVIGGTNDVNIIIYYSVFPICRHF